MLDVRVGWVEYDATATVPPSGDDAARFQVNVGFIEFDAAAAPYQVCMGWFEFDVLSPTAQPIPPYQPGGGVARYHYPSTNSYDIPITPSEDDDEELILSIMLEIAAHAIL